MEKLQEKNLSGVFYGVHDIRVDQLAMPEISNRAILIKVAAAGICGSDLHFYNAGNVPVGSVLGHEFAGTIVEMGKSVKNLAIGLRVVVNPNIAGTGIGLTPGGFAEYVLIDQVQVGHNVFPIPYNISDEQGAMIEPLSVAIAAVKLAEFRAADNMLIHGAGTIGLATLASLLALGAKNIVVSDISEARLAIARTLGATHTFNPTTDGDITDFLKRTYGTQQVILTNEEVPNLQVVFDCAGVPAVLSESIENLAPNGKLIILAVYKEKANMDAMLIMLKMLTIKGTFGFTPQDMQEAIDLVAAEKVDLLPLVTHRFPLQELPQAFEMQANPELAVKVLVTPE